MNDALVFLKKFKGFYIQFQNFNHGRTAHQWSFALGGCREPVYLFKDGYDKPMTHKGKDTYFFGTFFNYQLSVGYEKLEKVLT